jgi:hypothetical protein
VAATPVTNRPPTNLRVRLSWLAGPLLLFVICCGFYWRLILSGEYTWLDSPDLAHQEAPRFQFEATRWQQGAFPLWDPHQWCGQPFLGQVVGAANPVNWPFFLLPLDENGKVPLAVFHWYFVAIHFLGGLFAYWLCRDLQLSRAASLAGGLVFALSGFFGSNLWIGIMGGFLWMPLVFLFLLRLLRDYRPTASAALCGLFLGAAWLSGHHEVPIYLSFAVGGIWLYHLAISNGANRRRLLLLAAITSLIAALTSGLQTIPAYEYAGLAQRWVGADHALSWNESIPYSVDTTYSFRPSSLVGLVVPWLANDSNGYLGVVALTLAVLGVVTRWRERWVRLFTAVALFGLLFSMGTYNIFHGILYAVMPLFGKARVPGRLLCMLDFAAAPLAAYGLEALLAGVAVRRIALALAALGGGLYAIALGSSVIIQKFAPAENVIFTGLAALLLAGVLLAWQRGVVAAGFVGPAVFALMLAEFGMVTGAFAERSGKGQGAYVGKLTAYEDIARFLKKHRGLVRIDFDDTFNFGDWEGIDSLKGFGASVTSNILQLEWASPRTQDLLGVTYSVARAPARPGQELVFQGSSGFNVYWNPGAFPRVWTVHRAELMSSAANVRAAIANPAFDFRETAPLLEGAPALATCEAPENVWMTARSAGSVSIAAQMGCRGMVVIADTWYPGWYATVDGRPATIYRPYAALRGVVVEKGSHTVALRYRPRSAMLGAIMTAAGILGACVLALGLPGRRFLAACVCLGLCLTRGAFAQTATDSPVKTTLCEIVKRPEYFNGKVVQFRATVESGVMDLPSGVADESCSAELPFFAPDDQHLAALLKNKKFRKLQKDLAKTPLVQATVTGRFEHLPAKKPDSLLVLESVGEVVAKPAKPAQGRHPA